MAEYETHYRWKLRVNSPESMLERIGGWLRGLAACLDQRHSLAIKIVTTPKISRRAEIECIEHGMESIQWAVRECVAMEACEVLMKSLPHVDWNPDGR